MGRQFTALRVVGTIYKVLAWLVLILGLIVAIGALVLSFVTGINLDSYGIGLEGPLTGVAAFLVVLIGSVIYFLLLYAFGEAIYLFLAIEENTRRTAYFIQQQSTPQEQVYATPKPRPSFQE